MCGYADNPFWFEEPYALLFYKLHLFKNIISCYLAPLQEIGGKYQIVCNELKFC